MSEQAAKVMKTLMKMMKMREGNDEDEVDEAEARRLKDVRAYATKGRIILWMYISTGSELRAW